MKKHLTTLFLFAATMLAALTLSACGEEVQIKEDIKNEDQMTVFSSGAGGTRTSIDKDAKFYWETGDQIWIDENGDGSYATVSDKSELFNEKKSAKFYFRGKVLSKPSYPVLYSGNGAATATKVRILNVQTQSEWNNAEHIGKSGDCGIATATRQTDGSYSFILQHKAAYLDLCPYLNTYQTDNFTLEYIHITSTSALCGAFPFSQNGINTSSPIGITHFSVRLECGTSGFLLDRCSEATITNHCYAVIAPGTHSLTIRYYVKRADNTSFVFTKKADLTIAANDVITFKHLLSPDFYMWDAPTNAPYSYGVNNFNTVNYPTQASQSCAYMPNINELYWYMLNGDPRWDETTTWSIDGGTTTHTGGLWIKKRAVIIAEGKTFSSTIGYNNQDNRRIHLHWLNESPSETYKTGGKPDASVIDNYFFLPAYGAVETNGMAINVGSAAYYWTTSPSVENTNYAYRLAATRTLFHVSHAPKQACMIGGTRPDGTPWFQ